MSGIAGFVHLDGRPADLGLLERMRLALKHRGADGLTFWSGGRAGLIHAKLETTPESLEEEQPLLDARNNCCLTCDGRVDNREELRDFLKGQGFPPRDRTDAELVLQAYCCWGSEAPARILGDFAFAIWDGNRRQLFCARDILGVRPFFYHCDAKTFRFASEIRTLLADDAVPREPNEGMVGEYLACAITSLTDTLYKDIFRLPPGHTLTVADGRVRVERYWNPDPQKTIRYQTDVEYAEHFRELFKAAVRCRMRSHRPIAMDLSGGLDSSSVACMAHLLAREEACPGLETFSLVFPGQPCDESAFIRASAQRWGMTNHMLEPSILGPDEYATWARRFMDFPGHPNGWMRKALVADAAARGARVLLGGFGGDDWLQGLSPGERQAERLRRGRLAPFAQELFQKDVFKGLATAWRAGKHVAKRWLPESLLRLRRRLLGRSSEADWISPEFMCRFDVAGRLRSKRLYRGEASADWDFHFQVGAGGWQVHAMECEERQSSWNSMENRYPFQDRRLVEFALSLPEDQRGRGEWTKFVLREAMRGILPESVRLRCDKAYFETVFERTFRQNEMESELGQMNAAWIRAAEFQRRLAKAHNAISPEGCDLWHLWMACGIGFWYRSQLNHEVPNLGKKGGIERQLALNSHNKALGVLAP